MPIPYLPFPHCRHSLMHLQQTTFINFMAKLECFKVCCMWESVKFQFSGNKWLCQYCIMYYIKSLKTSDKIIQFPPIDSQTIQYIVVDSFLHSIPRIPLGDNVLLIEPRIYGKIVPNWTICDKMQVLNQCDLPDLDLQGLRSNQ